MAVWKSLSEVRFNPNLSNFVLEFAVRLPTLSIQKGGGYRKPVGGLIRNISQNDGMPRRRAIIKVHVQEVSKGVVAHTEAARPELIPYLLKLQSVC